MSVKRKIKPIPKAALPVVEILRRDVPKPLKTLRQKQTAESEATPWYRNGYCPMGLHPGSTSSAPDHSAAFAGGAASNTAVYAYGSWWDEAAKIDFDAAEEATWPSDVTAVALSRE